MLYEVITEYRFSSDWSGFSPQAGLFVTEDSGAYIYGGAGFPIALVITSYSIHYTKLYEAGIDPFC